MTRPGPAEAERSSGDGRASAEAAWVVPETEAERPEQETPLPDLPPLPADPRWKVAHLPFLSAVSAALMVCAGSAGFFARGPAGALGAAAGVLMVTVSYTMSTLAIAWADTLRPRMVLPLALGTYLMKYSLLGVILVFGVSPDWSGAMPLGLGIVAGVVVWTAVQAWWLTKFANRQ